MADCVAAIVLLSSCCEPLIISEFPFLVCICTDECKQGRTLPNCLPEQNKCVRADSTHSATEAFLLANVTVGCGKVCADL